MTSADVTYANAVKTFQNDNEPIIPDFSGATALTVKKSLLALQSDQEGRNALMNLTRLAPMIKALEEFESLLGLEKEKSEYIWGPLRFCLLVKNEEHLKSVIETYHEFSKHMPKISGSLNKPPHDGLFRDYMACVYLDILKLHSACLRLVRLPTPTGASSVDSDYKAKIEDISSHFDMVMANLDNISLKLNKLEDSNQLSKRQEDIQKKQKLDATLNWLNGSTEFQHAYHERLQGIRGRHPRATEWILSEHRVSQWIKERCPEYPILWVNGFLGTGKTVVVSRIIDECKSLKSDFDTSYFYCHSDASKQTTSLSIYISLLRQMITQNEKLLSLCYEKKIQSADSALQDTAQTLGLVELCCGTGKGQFVIIDGLEELREEEARQVIASFVHLFKSIAKVETGILRILFVSRDSPKIRHNIKDLDLAATIDIGPDKNRREALETLIFEEAGRLCTKFQSRSLSRKALELVKKRADGNFLFAELAMQECLDQDSLAEGMNRLEEAMLPQSLSDAYRHMLLGHVEDLGEKRFRTATNILGWLACSSRPLFLREIQAASSIVVQHYKCVNIDHSSTKSIRDIEELCGCLVKVRGDLMVFAHHTVKSYLISNGHIDTQSIHCDMAITCLLYLSSHWIYVGLEETHRRAYAEQGYYAFLDYAASQWTKHLEAVITNGVDLFNDAFKGPEYREKMTRALAGFVQVYERDLVTHPSDDEWKFLTSARERCSSFQDQEFHDNLVLIWTHVSSMRSTKNRGIGIRSLSQSTDKIRQELECIPIEKDEGFASFYGTSIFKCDKTECDYFHLGFSNAPQRDKHIDKHYRPYECDEPGCSLSPFGFATKKQKEKHMRTYHLTLSLNEASGSIEHTRQLTNSKFTCDDCGRSFTRNANLIAHQRDHTGLRPFECSHCDRAFTRNNDRRRHERTRHRHRQGGQSDGTGQVEGPKQAPEPRIHDISREDDTPEGSAQGMGFDNLQDVWNGSGQDSQSGGDSLSSGSNNDKCPPNQIRKRKRRESGASGKSLHRVSGLDVESSRSESTSMSGNDSEGIDMITRANSPMDHDIGADTLSYARTEFMDEIRSQTLAYIHGYDGTVVFMVDWSPRDFMKNDYDSDAKLRQVLTLTGNLETARLCPVSDYMSSTWPLSGLELVVATEQAMTLQASYGGENIDPSVHAEEYFPFPFSTMEIKVSSDLKTFLVTGSQLDTVFVAQQLSWLSAACRQKPDSTHMYSKSSFRTSHCDDEGRPVFSIETHLESSPENAEKACWEALVGPSIIVTDFPCPSRSHSGQRGLEIAIPIMAALSDIPQAVTFNDTYVFKGQCHALVPTEVHDDSIQWHLVDSYPKELPWGALKTEVPCMAPIDLQDLQKLQGMRSFLGWCPNVVDFLGTNGFDFGAVEYSGARKPEPSVKFGKMTFGFTQWAQVTGEFSLGARSVFRRPNDSDNHFTLLKRAEATPVILHDTTHDRAVQTDAENIILHLILHQKHEAAMNPDIPFTQQRSDAQHRLIGACPRREAMTTRQAMLENAEKVVRVGPRISSPGMKEVTFKEEVKLFFSTLQGLQGVDYPPDASTGMSKPWQSKRLDGWEYMELVKDSTSMHPKKVDLKPSCGEWVGYAKDIESIVLFAANLPDLLTAYRDDGSNGINTNSARSICNSYASIPCDYSYLAVQVPTLRELFKKQGSLQTQRSLSQSGYYIKPRPPSKGDVLQLHDCRQQGRTSKVYASPLYLPTVANCNSTATTTTVTTTTTTPIAPPCAFTHTCCCDETVVHKRILRLMKRFWLRSKDAERINLISRGAVIFGEWE